MSNPKCYIDAEGRVTCDGAPGQASSPMPPTQAAASVACCVDQQGIVHCSDPAHPMHRTHVSYAPQFGLHPSQIPACPPTAASPQQLQAPDVAPTPGTPGGAQRPNVNPGMNPMQNPTGYTIAATQVQPPGSAFPRPGAAPSASGYLVARPMPKPDCCVHIKTDALSTITPQNPKPGRIDCPETPAWHEREVTVIGIQGDGQGGTLARVIFEPMPGGAGPGGGERMQNVVVGPKLIPVCSAGPQDKKPIPCCLAYGRDGRTLVVQCADASHPMHGRPADEAVKQGYTLAMCEPPPKVPPCCFELGNFGGKNNARLICEDESHPAHGRAVQVTVASDGTTAAWKGEIEGSQYVLEMPVCVIEEEPEEIPCCVRNGVLECPGTPYHGMSYEDFKKKHADARLMPCPEIPPPPPPPDCCVRIEGKRAVLVCSGGPWNGYELKPGEFTCHDTAQGKLCRVRLEIPGQSGIQAATFPVCPPGVEPVPPDCCYDVGTGRLICTDTASQFHNLQVSLIDMQGGLPHSNGYVLVAHPSLGSVPVKFPVCDVPVPPECCFEPSNSATTGARGRLLCPGSDLHGKTGTIMALNKMPDGSMLATVSYLGGASRMPLCAPPCEECPPCEPPYFCCVNLDTGRFVCPANPARHGKQADIKEVIELHGSPWVVLTNGQRVPACGMKCPPPGPECPPLLIPPGDPGTNTPLGPPAEPPCEPGPAIPPGDPGTNTPVGPPAEPPCEPTPAIPPGDPGTNTPVGPPAEPPCDPAPGIPRRGSGTNTPPGPPAEPPCVPTPTIPPSVPGTNTPPGPPAEPPCVPTPTIPAGGGGTNTPPGPPAPGPCDPAPGVPRPPPFR